MKTVSQVCEIAVGTFLPCSAFPDLFPLLEGRPGSGETPGEVDKVEGAVFH